MQTTYFRSREIFLRLISAVYLVAFLSFWVQAEGLIGSKGILSVKDFLEAARSQLGPERYWILPTLCWINSSDTFLHLLCGGGALFSIFVMLGVAPAAFLALCWGFYLSLVVAGQDFMEFQWDILLLEAGFLAIFLAPLRIRPRKSSKSRPSAVILWLLRWLLFRLVFSSGVVKLASGDPSWRTLTALNYHYETQPLPTWMGWYAHQLPAWFQKFSTGIMFGVELGIPFLIFAPRRFRLFGCFVMIGFQILILVTGNYCFFNLLAILLCLLLIDDSLWPGHRQEVLEPRGPAWPKWVTLPLAAVILLVTSLQMTHLLHFRPPWPAPLTLLHQMVAPFRTVNGYGLFAVMTTSRPEIIVEGSDDGENWQAYEFKWKPGDLRRRPGFVAPHQPRLDWQMWFAALASYRQNPWFMNFLARLLEGSSDVTRLLEKNPFPDRAPRFLRAVVYDYRFTNLATRRQEGVWWRRKEKRLYCPVVSLDFSR